MLFIFFYNPFITVAVKLSLDNAQPGPPPPVQISSSLHDGKFACPDSVVIFTCWIRPSSGIAWESEEYIGPGNAQLSFSRQDTNGSRANSSIRADTFAVFYKRRMREGGLMLHSKLHVTTSTYPQNASVTCRHTGDGVIETIHFQVLGEFL